MEKIYQIYGKTNPTTFWTIDGAFIIDLKFHNLYRKKLQQTGSLFVKKRKKLYLGKLKFRFFLELNGQLCEKKIYLYIYRGIRRIFGKSLANFASFLECFLINVSQIEEVWNCSIFLPLADFSWIYQQDFYTVFYLNLENFCKYSW